MNPTPPPSPRREATAPVTIPSDLFKYLKAEAAFPLGERTLSDLIVEDAEPCDPRQLSLLYGYLLTLLDKRPVEAKVRTQALQLVKELEEGGFIEPEQQAWSEVLHATRQSQRKYVTRLLELCQSRSDCPESLNPASPEVEVALRRGVVAIEQGLLQRLLAEDPDAEVMRLSISSDGLAQVNDGFRWPLKRALLQAFTREGALGDEAGMLGEVLAAAMVAGTMLLPGWQLEPMEAAVSWKRLESVG